MQVKAKATVKIAAKAIRTTSSLAYSHTEYMHVPSSAKMWRTYFILPKIRRLTVRITRMMKMMFAILTLDTLEDRLSRSNWLISTSMPPKSTMFSLELCLDMLLGAHSWFRWGCWVR